METGKLTRVLNIGLSLGVRRRGGAAATPWWLEGGAPAPVGAWDAAAAASKAASLVNQVNAGTFDLTEAGTVSWTAGTGWHGFSNVIYFDSGITPVTGYSMICQFSGGSVKAAGCEVAGNSNATDGRFRLGPISAANNAQRLYAYGSSLVSTATAVTSGVMAITPTNMYYNGVSDASGTYTISATSASIFIGTTRNYLNGFWNGNIQRIAIYDYNIASYAAAITAAMAAL
jgi:hypothetical protein